MVAIRRVIPAASREDPRVARTRLLLDQTALNSVSQILSNVRHATIIVTPNCLKIIHYQSGVDVVASRSVAQALLLTGRTSFCIEDQMSKEAVREMLLILMQE